jgi:transcriptional regulator with XRE-family HTH domain
MTAMERGFEAGRLLHEARTRAGLTQRELARRAGTAQSVVARIEAGQTSPTVGTLERLLDAAGFEPRIELTHRPAADSHMLEDVARILRLTPEERLLEIRNISRFVAAAGRG